jgi:SAM-dependent methyltransferase
MRQRPQATWASDDFALIGSSLYIVGESLADATEVRAGAHLLDVAAGNGIATRAAARRFAHVTSTDSVPVLFDMGRERARAEGLCVHFQPAGAEDLPFEDRSFDIVLSTFGAMFTPNHRRIAREMLRVLRSGGRIGMANWTPDGFIGRLFGLIGAHVPLPAGLRSPALWGTESHIVELFGTRSTKFRCERRHFNFRYRSAAHWIQVFRDSYGPIHRAFAALDLAGRHALERDITLLLGRMNTAGATSLVVPSEYLEVVITKH